VRIKVNPNKSVSENAQIYFNKYKDIDKKLLAEDVKTNTLSYEISILSDINNKLNAVSSLSELKRLYKKLIDLNLLSMTTSSSNKSDKQQIAFKHFVLEDNWHVYIGKSGENNDELTFNYAKKQDYWFHAQGVPGSHVILKVKQKDQVPPHQILEQVAGIAAANSKSKHSATVPVIYTQVRYVSRIRNAPKGTVNTRNEKTIFVEPFNI
jgi:predicted ribosome quality control (RQC) complex YloA/Tae2 family protein